MIEFPESINLARQLSDELKGKTVSAVLPPSKPHKFCWFSGDPGGYDAQLRGSILTGADGFGMFFDINFGNGLSLAIDDGINARLARADALPGNYQLAICFDGGDALVFTVSMYGGLCLHGEGYGNEYYIKSKLAISPLSPEFRAHFDRILAGSKPSLSMKALLATEQRFPGIGNGTVQDILFRARLNPKRKLGTLDANEREALFSAVVSVLQEMTDLGGRDTEKDIFGNPGGYKTVMSKNITTTGCPLCGGNVTKEAYLGGSVYYCADCQPKGD